MVIILSLLNILNLVFCDGGKKALYAMVQVIINTGIPWDQDFRDYF
jgi:hypothetical protein